MDDRPCLIRRPVAGATHRWAEAGCARLGPRLAPARAACMGDSGCPVRCREVLCDRCFTARASDLSAGRWCNGPLGPWRV